MTKLLELIDGFRVVHEEIIARRHQEKSRLKRNSPKALLQLEEVNIITQQSIDLELLYARGSCAKESQKMQNPKKRSYSN